MLSISSFVEVCVELDITTIAIWLVWLSSSVISLLPEELGHIHISVVLVNLLVRQFYLVITKSNTKDFGNFTKTETKRIS